MLLGNLWLPRGSRHRNVVIGCECNQRQFWISMQQDAACCNIVHVPRILLPTSPISHLSVYLGPLAILTQRHKHSFTHKFLSKKLMRKTMGTKTRRRRGQDKGRGFSCSLFLIHIPPSISSSVRFVKVALCAPASARLCVKFAQNL
jgi:hypothetical protein